MDTTRRNSKVYMVARLSHDISCKSCWLVQEVGNWQARTPLYWSQPCGTALESLGELGVRDVGRLRRVEERPHVLLRQRVHRLVLPRRQTPQPTAELARNL